MTDDQRTPGAEPTQDGGTAQQGPQPAGRRELLPLPGLAAICLYMVFLAGINVVSVVGGQVRPFLLVFSAAFLAAAGGLLLLQRWAWNLTLAALVMLAGLFFWKFTMERQFAFMVQGLLNLVFFFYLVRPEVREKLR